MGKLGPESLELRARRLERLQLHVAIGAPHAAVKADDQWTIGQQCRRRYRVTLGVLERERGRSGADLMQSPYGLNDV
jgi:hypothetical protein